MGRDAEFEITGRVMRLSRRTSCSETWFAFLLTQAFIPRTLSFFVLSSALGSEGETGDRPQSLPTRCAQSKGKDDRSTGSDSSLCQVLKDTGETQGSAGMWERSV